MSYLFAAYTIIWVVLFGYLVRLTLKANRLLREVESLKVRLAQETGSDRNPPSP